MQGSFVAALALIAGLAVGGEPVPIEANYETSFDAAYFDETSDLCGIYLDESEDGTYLAAYAAEGVEGEYVFNLRQEGPGGSSEISQSGEFEYEGDGPTLLSEMTLGSAGDFEASLQTYSRNGEFTCRAII